MESHPPEGSHSFTDPSVTHPSFSRQRSPANVPAGVVTGSLHRSIGGRPGICMMTFPSCACCLGSEFPTRRRPRPDATVRSTPADHRACPPERGGAKTNSRTSVPGRGIYLIGRRASRRPLYYKSRPCASSIFVKSKLVCILVRARAMENCAPFSFGVRVGWPPAVVFGNEMSTPRMPLPSGVR